MGDTFLQIVFWSTLSLVIYLHVGYPALLWLLSKISVRPVRRRDHTPTVDLVIGAYNEEAVIGSKIENCLELDYPKDRLQIIVVSDASTDGTNAIASEYQDRGVRLVVAPRRRGKAANFRALVPTLKSEITLFSDAGSLYRKDTIRQLMRNFADPDVGCVGGRIRYTNPDASTVSRGEGLYWRYEVFLRTAESTIASTVVLSGAVYAIRRELYRPVADHLPDDFMSPLNVLDQGRRVIYEPDSEIREKMATSASAQLATKIRIVSRNFLALMSMKHLLNPFRYPFLSLQLLSHRLLRWFVLPLAGVMLLSNFMLGHHTLYAFVMGAQFLFYVLAGLGFLMERIGWRTPFTYLPFYFVLVNLSPAIAIWRHITGRGARGVWEPVER